MGKLFSKINSKHKNLFLSLSLVTLLSIQYMYTRSSQSLSHENLAQLDSGEIDMASEALESLDPIQKEKMKLTHDFSKTLRPTIEDLKTKIEMLKAKLKVDENPELESILKKIVESENKLNTGIQSMDKIEIHMPQPQKLGILKNAKINQGESLIMVYEAKLALIEYVSKNKQQFQEEAEMFESVRSEVLAALNDHRVSLEVFKAEQ